MHDMRGNREDLVKRQREQWKVESHMLVAELFSDERAVK